MANVRDVLGHFSTFLDPSLDPSIRAEQVSYAEEHLRWAIIEPYQVAVDDLTEQIENLYGKVSLPFYPYKIGIHH
jgi:hypothetical protein